MTEPLTQDGLGPYAIGQLHWPGISKLIEEAGEVLQVCGKLMGTGGKVQHWDGTNLKERLEEELGDLVAAARFVGENCGLDNHRIVEQARRKYDLFSEWHEAALGAAGGGR